MNMTTTNTRVLPSTLGASFSFYVPATNANLIRTCAAMADAVTVRGVDGPSAARLALGERWEGPLLFDRAGYERGVQITDAQAESWFEAQERARADRLLTPGRWIEWSKDSDALAVGLDREWTTSLRASGSTILLALDVRWLGKDSLKTIATLAGTGLPLALVLGHRGDPLSANGVLDTLLQVMREIPNITILRSDHGAIGAIAFGAAHGSVGLRPGYRHFVPPATKGGGKPNDRTPRLFVWDLMDWFTGATIAGWGASSIRLECTFSCCKGARLDRFLDPAFESLADVHNRTVLSELANCVLDEEPEARRRAFARLCAEAVERYGPMGKLSDLIEPKQQLTQWAQWY